MNFQKRLGFIMVVGWMLVLSGCYNLVFKPGDMKNIRRQLHLPRSARFIAFDSNPKQAGFFGREGLRITGTLGFTDAEFQKYISQLNDPEIWQPVSYLSYSPSIGDEYTQGAFLWRDLPFPESLKKRFDHLHFLEESFDVDSGKYYCSVLVPERGEPLESNPAACQWNYIGKACLELTDSESPVIMTVAVLDSDKQIIYVYIQFSG